MENFLEITQEKAEIYEQLGSKEKFWFMNGDNHCLYKKGREGTGENWAEVVAAELCSLLNIPHADYGFAACDGAEGVYTDSFVPTGGRLVHGNELLGKFTRGSYDQAKQYKQTQYTMARVISVLRKLPGLGLPLGWESLSGTDNGLDVFVGYIMLDALIANQDRHHENWGIIVAEDGSVTLASSFDHASSLGRNESDDKREIRLHTKDKRQNMLSYVKRAKTPFYSAKEPTKKLGTLDAFLEIAKSSKFAALAWFKV